MKKDKIVEVFAYLFLITLAIVTVFPLIYTFLGSMKSSVELLVDQGKLFPKTINFTNYVSVLKTDKFDFGKMLFNSIYYTFFNVFVVIMSSSMAAYAFVKGEFPYKKIIFACFTALLFVKTGGMEIYPKFEILNAIGLNSGLIALMFLNLFGIPIVQIYLVMGYIQSLPKGMDEAAEIDGCGFIGIFFRIILPLLKPILATIGILSFQSSWNDYLMPTIFTVNKPRQQTLIVGLMSLKNSTGAATDWGILLAGTVLALLPVLAAYAVGNKYFVSGLAAGAVKE